MSADMRSQVNARYEAWKEYLRSVPPTEFFRSDRHTSVHNEPFRALVRLGPPAVPYLVELVRKDHNVSVALGRVTRWRYHCIQHREGDPMWPESIEEYPDLGGSDPSKYIGELWWRWWNDYRKRTPQEFARLHGEWKGAKAAGNSADAERLFLRMKDLGIAALPHLVEGIRNGDEDLIPIVSELTNAAVTPDASTSDIAKWWQKNRDAWLIPDVQLSAE